MKKLLLSIIVLITLQSCCRQANEFNFQKWENKRPFEKKVSYVKYPGKKKTVIRY
jgi:hypothetical protein